MPDDITEVTEHEEVTPDTEIDEEKAFADESDNEEIMETHPPEKIEETPGKIEEETETEVETETSLDKPVETEEDEDILRGKELLEVEPEKTAEEIEAEKATEKVEEEVAPLDAGYEEVFNVKNSADDIEFYNSIGPKDLLPEEVTLKDGTVLDFATWQAENPEAVPAIRAVSHNLIMQMIANGYLVDVNRAKALAEGQSTTLDQRLFDRTLTNRQDGVPKALEIKESKEYKDWLTKEPKEIQALEKSKDPYDHIRLYTRFLNKAGLEEAKEKVAEKDKEKKKAKAKFDAVHKTTVKGSQTKPAKTLTTGKEEEKAAFESDDDDDDLY